MFWLTIAVTLCALVPFSLFPIMRAWLAVVVLFMWACFFTANAVRSHRTHSIISAPVYFFAAAMLACSAWGLIAVDIGWVVLGAGISPKSVARFVGTICKSVERSGDTLRKLNDWFFSGRENCFM